ncbi:MAG: FkbM family methyltransferase [Planctomycetes bacterium]|nr:FkbM family methyltransferase [Planctomycetota bacterium]
MLRRLVSHSGLLYRTPVPQDDEGKECYWREVEQDICHCLVRAGDTTIDVGANAGGYLRPLLNAGCRCVAFECNPRLRRALEAKYRGDDRVTVRGEALSSETGIVSLRIPMRWWSESDGGSTIKPANRVSVGFWPVKRVAVQRCTLDSVLHDPMALIKSDVEGHELDVLKGATSVLEKSCPGLIVECEDRHRAGATSEMFYFLESRGYKGFFILDAKIHPLREFTLALQNPAELAKGLPRRTITYVNNFIFLHDSRDPHGTLRRIEESLQRLQA